MTRRLRLAAPAILLAALAAAWLAARLPRVRGWIGSLADLIGAIPGDHWPLFCLAQALAAASGIVPASMMGLLAGAAFGMGNGLLVSAAATMLGGWLAFLLSRSVLRPWIARLLDRHGAAARFDEAVGAEGWRFVCLLRMSPVMPFAATSYGLGMTRISQRSYLLGTLASLPSLAGYVALGACGRAGIAAGGDSPLLRWLLALLGVAALFVAAARVNRLVAKAAGASCG